MKYINPGLSVESNQLILFIHKIFISQKFLIFNFSEFVHLHSFKRNSFAF